MRALHERGVQPTSGKVQAELGENVRNGGDLNGRDVVTFREEMLRLGYVSTKVGYGNRWVKR